MYYNQSGTGSFQLVDFGTGFTNAFAESGAIDGLSARPMSPKELADTVRLSHRSQGLRAIRRWVDQGSVPSPVGTCQWLVVLLSGFLARLWGLIPRKVATPPATRR